MTSRVAAGCVRTLLLAGIASQPLFAASLHFIADPVDLEGLSESRVLVAQTLTTVATRIPSEQRSAAVAVIMNALLERAGKEGASTHQETSARLLDLAAMDNATFRAVVTGMDGERRELLERILKARAGAQQVKNDSDEDREPTIALKMNFGG